MKTQSQQKPHRHLAQVQVQFQRLAGTSHRSPLASSTAATLATLAALLMSSPASAQLFPASDSPWAGVKAFIERASQPDANAAATATTSSSNASMSGKPKKLATKRVASLPASVDSANQPIVNGQGDGPVAVEAPAPGNLVASGRRARWPLVTEADGMSAHYNPQDLVPSQGGVALSILLNHATPMQTAEGGLFQSASARVRVPCAPDAAATITGMSLHAGLGAEGAVLNEFPRTMPLSVVPIGQAVEARLREILEPLCR